MGSTFLVNFCRSCPKGFRAAEMNGLSKLFDFPEYLAECLQDETTVVTPSSTFAIWVDAIGKKLNQQYKVERIEGLSFLDIQGTIDLDHPDIHFHLLEYCGEDSSQKIKQPLEIFFGRLVGKGRLRTLPSSYDLKTRNYIGNTSMDPLFSFIATNLAAVAENDIVYDPFVGTGSLLLSAAHFGAYCFGNDINYNTIFGRGKSSRSGVKIKQRHENIRSNFEQYESIEHFIGTLCADSSRAPYGIREKASKIGMKNEPAQNIFDEKSLAG
uniref:tRNA (guanine(10)-N(2))-methyltransferase TRMT11 N-terminal domain-containing protein n=1 Tax=Romanomermis culicivorax TaxID=13658 RepID=A0A915HTN9_ROMCU